MMTILITGPNGALQTLKVNRAWEDIMENIKVSAKESLGCYELKKYKPWFNRECSEFLSQRK
jgi:hypothetical protein